MVKTRKYVSVKGPQQRKRLLRELGRAEPRKKFTPSPRDIRRSVGKMFAFTPLSPLSETERALLKRYAELTVSRAITRQMKKGKAMLSEDARLIVGRPDETVKADRERVKQIFLDGKRYNSTIFEYRGQPMYVRHYESVGLKESSFDILKTAKKVYRRKGSRILALDVGAFTGKMLAELGKEMGNKVETHALSPDDVPREKVDFYHMLLAEYLPREFSKKFDLVIAENVLQFSLFPNLGIRNISRALAPGGIALVQWIPERGALVKRHLKTQADKFFSSYEDARISREAVKLVVKGSRAYREWEGRNLSEARVRERMKASIERAGYPMAQALAWCNEIASLRSSPYFKVKITRWGFTPFGRVPILLQIERKR